MRLVSGVLLPGLAFFAHSLCTDLRWPLIAILICELAIGGRDNLLSHHRVAGNARLWAARTLVASALLLIGFAYLPLHHVLMWAAAVITVVGVAAELREG